MSQRLVIESLTQIESVLNSYYRFAASQNLSAFMLPNIVDLKMHGRVLFDHDNAGDLVIGFQFGQEFMDSLSSFHNVTELPLHQMCVLAEELSHFYLLCDAYTNQSQLTQLDVEVMGEIDRFLVLLAFAKPEWRNLHDVCDAVMSGATRFADPKNELYIKAEGLAFKHLKLAFMHCWDNSRFDFEKIDARAANYLSALRKNYLNQNSSMNTLATVA